jgi:hypothetical protein
MYFWLAFFMLCVFPILFLTPAYVRGRYACRSWSLVLRTPPPQRGFRREQVERERGGGGGGSEGHR